jgi:hypothetical protein
MLAVMFVPIFMSWPNIPKKWLSERRTYFRDLAKRDRH